MDWGPIAHDSGRHGRPRARAGRTRISRPWFSAAEERERDRLLNDLVTSLGAVRLGGIRGGTVAGFRGGASEDADVVPLRPGRSCDIVWHFGRS